MKKSLILKFAAVALCLVLAFVGISACGKDNKGSVTNFESSYTKSEAPTNFVCMQIEHDGEMLGEFVMELYPDEAPITVANFQELVAKGHYDGLKFHRIVDGFMAQGGDPKGNGTGGTDPIKGEFAANGVDNQISHTRGVVSMARRGDSYDSGSCQFFICFDDSCAASLDGQYAAFAKVVRGMEVVDSLQQVERTWGNDNAISSPVEDVIIKNCFFVEGI